jgi:hypothetical protein
MKTKFSFKIFISLITLFSLTTCVQPREVDRSLVTQSPCAPPCWYGLELEKSTKDDVLDALNTLQFVDENKITFSGLSDQFNLPSEVIYYGCNDEYKQTGCGGFFTLTDGKLSTISYTIGYELTFKEVFDLYGPPGVILSQSPTTPVGGCSLGLHWPENHLYTLYIDNVNMQPCNHLKESMKISPNLKVNYVRISVIEMSGFDPDLTVRLLWDDNFEKK